ncbi:MAG TPA: response regulator transcription factor [Firmicutes bacterium]|nr:response regulator transcription factor [Bacillota bacterium]
MTVHPKILIVDDDRYVTELLEIYLKREGFEVRSASDGVTALSLAADIKPDLVILDIMLPGVSGWEVCRKLRTSSDVPVIMLTAKGEKLDKLKGFELGTDDYVTKPFDADELVERVKAFLRRARPDAFGGGDEVRHADLYMNRRSRSVEVKGREITLSPKEFDLLWYMASNPNRVFNRDELLEKVWGYEYFGGVRTVDTHIKQLRQKIEEDPDAPRYIHTVWGVGYKFNPRP